MLPLLLLLPSPLLLFPLPLPLPLPRALLPLLHTYLLRRFALAQNQDAVQILFFLLVLGR
jgi:hypothetical protein